MSCASTNTPERILIYRLGSLGDTVVALPALRLVAKVFPNAERWVLTNFSVSSKEAPMSQVLKGMGLVHDFIEYPIGLRNVSQLANLIFQIRTLEPEVLVYMAAPRGRMRAYRDALFFRACGIRRLIGVPYTKEFQKVRRIGNNLYEHEGTRLARCLAELGECRLRDPTSFDLQLKASEISTAQESLEGLPDGRPVLAASIGAKVDVKDWGDAKWKSLFEMLSHKMPGWGLVMLGSADEQERCDRLLQYWAGWSLNLCGNLPVRASAAVLADCKLFVGHDSGPMHLAAAVGLPCVAIFSAQNLPGEWFPFGGQHKILYRLMPCQGCRLAVCNEYQKACIRAITVEEVKNAVIQLATHRQCA